jgi:hypothetical protein
MYKQLSKVARIVTFVCDGTYILVLTVYCTVSNKSNQISCCVSADTILFIELHLFLLRVSEVRS